MTADTLSLEGKVAIVTGSARENGIGAGIATALARNGAAVTITYVSESSGSRAENVAGSIRKAGGKATVIRADVTVLAEAQNLVNETLKAFKVDHIDILVNNAGWGVISSTLESSEELINQIYAVNVKGPIFLTQTAVPYMPSGGRIINITSVASKVGLEHLPVYGSSKAALDSLTYAWAQEFGRSKGITVNSVAPGPVATDLVKEVGEKMDATGAMLVGMTRAADRVGTVEDIADAVLLLASEKGRWITGQFVSASGGITGQ